MGDLRAEAELVAQLSDGGGQSRRIETARVGHELDAAVAAGAEHLFELPQECGRIPPVRVALPVLPENEPRHLREVAAGEHVDRAALPQLPTRREPVTEE